MPTLTLTALANTSAQFLGALDSGESLSSQQITDALGAVNAWIDNLSSDRLMALSAKVDTFATTNGTVSYALATRYSAIEAASVLTPAPLVPLKIVNAVEWAAVPDRGVSNSFMRLLMEIAPDRVDLMALLSGQTIPTGAARDAFLHLLLDKASDRPDLVVTLAASGITNAAALAGILRLPGTPQGMKPPDMVNVFSLLNNQPRYLFYDRGNTTGTVYLGGPPQTGSVQIVAWSAMSQFADATTPLTMIPGYQLFLELGAAIILAPQYSVAPSQQLLSDYADATARIRQLNASILGPEPPAGIVSPAATQTPVSSTQGSPGSV